MAHRVVEIAWFPRTDAEWATFTAARAESARMWSAMVTRHARIRRLGWKWPTQARWDKWARGRFPMLSAQSVQQVLIDFADALSATAASRKIQATSGAEVTARYPWRTKAKYRDVPYSNQCADVRGGVLRLSTRDRYNPLRIPLPKGRPLPGRHMEVSLGFGVIRLVCKVADSDVVADGPLVGVDLGSEHARCCHRRADRGACERSGAQGDRAVRQQDTRGASLAHRPLQRRFSAAKETRTGEASVGGKDSAEGQAHSPQGHANDRQRLSAQCGGRRQTLQRCRPQGRARSSATNRTSIEQETHRPTSLQDGGRRRVETRTIQFADVSRLRMPTEMSAGLSVQGMRVECATRRRGCPQHPQHRSARR